MFGELVPHPLLALGLPTPPLLSKEEGLMFVMQYPVGSSHCQLLVEPVPSPPSP